VDRRDDLRSAIRELFERPALREWEQSLSDDEFLECEWSQLAREIVALAPDDTISGLTAIAPALEGHCVRQPGSLTSTLLVCNPRVISALDGVSMIR
jgi:hypothetical protein